MNAVSNSQSAEIWLIALAALAIVTIVALQVYLQRYRRRMRIERNDYLLNRRDNFPVGDMQEQQDPQ